MGDAGTGTYPNEQMQERGCRFHEDVNNLLFNVPFASLMHAWPGM